MEEWKVRIPIIIKSSHSESEEEKNTHTSWLVMEPGEIKTDEMDRYSKEMQKRDEIITNPSLVSFRLLCFALCFSFLFS